MKTGGTLMTIVFVMGIGLVSAQEAKAALAAPTGLSVSAGIDTLTISWNAVSGAASYKVYPTADCSGMGKPSLVNSYSYATKKDATYQFTVRAVDSAKVLGACSSATSSMSSSQLAAPTGLSVTRAVNAFTITWSARANASYYQLFTADGTCGGKPKKVTGTSYTMTGKLATTYNFAIRALTAKGRSGICSSATGARYVLPAAPTVSGVTIGTDGSTRTVSWSKVKNVTFTVQRSTTASNSGFSNLGTGLTSTSYTETSACPVATCYYKVVASAHGDNSADSNVVTSSGTGGGAAPTTLASSVVATQPAARSVNLTWTPATSTAVTGYDIYINTAPYSGWSHYISLPGRTTNSYSFVGSFSCGTTYTFDVKARTTSAVDSPLTACHNTYGACGSSSANQPSVTTPGQSMFQSTNCSN